MIINQNLSSIVTKHSKKLKAATVSVLGDVSSVSMIKASMLVRLCSMFCLFWIWNLSRDAQSSDHLVLPLVGSPRHSQASPEACPRPKSFVPA